MRARLYSQLRELDLELALGAVGVAGEDVEDHRRAVDDRQAERGLEVALLARRELVVAGDDVGVGALRERLDLLDLARPEIGVGVRRLAVLDGLPDDGDAGRAQKLVQLGEVVALGQRRDAEGALLGAPLARLARARGLAAASVTTLVLHPADSRPSDERRNRSLAWRR